MDTLIAHEQDGARQSRRGSSQPEGDCRLRRAIGVVAGRQGSRDTAVRPAGRSRSGDSRRVDREDPPARSWRARFDHRYRWRRLRDGVAGRRACRRVTAQRGQRHREVRARDLSRACPGDRAAAEGRARLRRAGCSRAGHADRRAARHRVRIGVRTLPAMRLESVGYGAGDKDFPGHAERASGFWSGRRTSRDRTGRRPRDARSTT